MSGVIGDQFSAGIGIQANRGTAAANLYYGAADSLDLNHSIDFKDIKTGQNNIVDAKSHKKTKEYTDPAMAGPVFDVLIGHILHASMGNVNTTADSPEAGVHSHDFSVLNGNDHPLSTLVRKDGISTRQVIDAIVTKFQLDIANENEATYQAEFRGKSPSDVTVTEAVTDEVDFGPDEAQIFIEDDEAALNTAEASHDAGTPSTKCLENFSLVLEKPALESYCIGNLDPNELNNGKVSVTGSFTVKYTGTEFDTPFENGSYKAIRVRLKSLEGIGTSSNPTLTITLPKIGFKEVPRSNNENDFVRQTIAFKAFYDGTKVMGATLVNETAAASYAAS